MVLRTRTFLMPPKGGRRRIIRIHKGGDTNWDLIGAWETPYTPAGRGRELSTCIDSVDKGDCGQFEVTHNYHNSTPISGKFHVSSNATFDWYVECDNLIPVADDIVGINGGAYGTPPSSPSDQQLVTSLLAKSNPNVPEFSFINFALEMRELPDLVRSTGRTAIHAMAGANLKMHFGLTPFLNDINYLLDFQAAVDKQIALLQYARKNGYIRRTRTLHVTESSSYLTNRVWDGGSNECSVTGQLHYKWKKKVSGHVRWFTTEQTPKTDTKIAIAARAQVLGLPLSSYGAMSVAWEALPWSWLIDWFTTIGQYLEANNNNLGLEARVIRLMEHTRCDYSIIPLKGTYRTAMPLRAFYESASAVYEKKVRRVPSTFTASLTSRAEFLNWTQFGILASLSVTKTGRFPRNSPTLSRLIKRNRY